jgi:hypothetical protein
MFGVGRRGFVAMIFSVQMMRVGQMRVMRRRFVIACLMMMRRFFMMFGGKLVMARGVTVMFGSFLSVVHGGSSMPRTVRTPSYS